MIDLLKQYRAWQNQERLKCGDLWQDKDFIFTQWNSEPIFVDTISKWFSKFRERNNLPELAFHQTTRHTNASLLISQGVNIQTVSKRLGHARTSTTTDIYAHDLKRPNKEAADKLENLFNKKNEQKEKQA
ncbi:MAG: tyrosine-type recombinase/integrase [Dehalobacterium sp.]